MTSPPEEVERRTAVRALLVSPDKRVLLLQVREPGDGTLMWITPGGGLEESEDPQDGLRREVREETGYGIEGPAPLVWRRHHRFAWNHRRVDQQERFFLVPVPRFEPTNAGNPDPGEHESFLRFRWWSLGEITASDELFVPRRMGADLAPLLDGHIPSEPIEIGT